LVLLTAIGTVLLTIRVLSTQTILFTFLLWNLFLAFIPILFSKSLLHTKRVYNSKTISGIFLIFWLLFLPNSPYIMTDLKHVDNNYGIQWFDFILILTFGLNGLLMGAISILDIFKLMTKRYSIKVTHTLVVAICLLGGFGIFLGRFLRFNSWDIVTKPHTLFYSIFHLLFMKETWIWTLVFGGFTWLSFILIKPLLKKE